MQSDVNDGESVQGTMLQKYCASTPDERLSGNRAFKGNSCMDILTQSLTSALSSMAWSALHFRCGAVQSA